MVFLLEKVAATCFVSQSPNFIVFFFVCTDGFHKNFRTRLKHHPPPTGLGAKFVLFNPSLGWCTICSTSNQFILESFPYGNVSPVLHCYSLHPGLDHRNRPITHTPGSFIGLTQDIQSWPRWKACGPRIRGCYHTHSWDFENKASLIENPLQGNSEINSNTWLDVCMLQSLSKWTWSHSTIHNQALFPRVSAYKCKGIIF